MYRGHLLRRASEESMVDGVHATSLGDEAASCFATAAARLAAHIPEAADECIDNNLRKELFPTPAHARAASANGRRGSAALRPPAARRASSAGAQHGTAVCGSESNRHEPCCVCLGCTH